MGTLINSRSHLIFLHKPIILFRTLFQQSISSIRSATLTIHKLIQEREFIILLLGLTIVGFLLRFVLILWIPTDPVSDFWSYFQRAKNIVEYGCYTDSPGRIDASYPPAYSILLSFLFRLPGNTLLMTKILNCMLSSISIFFMGLITRKIFGKKIAFIAVFIIILYPRSLLMPTLVAAENLFIPLLLIWIWVLFKQKDAVHPFRFVILGAIILGLLSLTRSIAYLLWIFWPIATLSRRIRIRTLLFEMLVLVTLQHVVMLPWAVRNFRSFGHLTFLNSVGGIDLFIGNNENAYGGWYDWSNDVLRADPKFWERDLMEQDNSARRAALSWIKRHPKRFLKLYYKKWGIIFRDNTYVPFFSIYGKDISPPGIDVLPGNHPLKNQEKLIYRLFNWTYWLLLLLEIIGGLVWIVISGKIANLRKFWQVLLILGTAFYFPAISALFLGMSRFNWPATTLLISTAALALFLIHSNIVMLKENPSLLLKMEE